MLGRRKEGDNEGNLDLWLRGEEKGDGDSPIYFLGIMFLAYSEDRYPSTLRVICHRGTVDTWGSQALAVVVAAEEEGKVLSTGWDFHGPWL